MKHCNNAKGYQQGSILIVAVLVVLLFFVSLIGSALLASQIGQWRKGEPTSSRYAGGGVPTGGCYLQDAAFRDTTSITTVDQVLDALPNQRGKLSKVKDELGVLIDKSRAANINPGIMIAFWGAEQSFNMKDGVFGCDCPPGEACPRHDKYKGMAGQLDCALPIIEDAIQNRGNYTNPKGQNIWTRLLYNYVAGARKQSYDRYGYVSDSLEARIWFLRKLVPNSVTCETAQFANTNMIPSAVAGIGVPLLHQCQPPWGSVDVGFSKARSNCGAGCGLTSSAMIVRFLNKSNTTPINVARVLGRPPLMQPRTVSNAFGLKIEKSYTGSKSWPDWMESELKAGHPILWRIKGGRGYRLNGRYYH
ncbi:MAG TPA: hypothetical protein PK263_05320, partial [bacterium]|nr:hypothetical protein [bacterium]